MEEREKAKEEPVTAPVPAQKSEEQNMMSNTSTIDGKKDKTNESQALPIKSKLIGSLDKIDSLAKKIQGKPKDADVRKA